MDKNKATLPLNSDFNLQVDNIVVELSFTHSLTGSDVLTCLDQIYVHHGLTPNYLLLSLQDYKALEADVVKTHSAPQSTIKFQGPGGSNVRALVSPDIEPGSAKIGAMYQSRLTLIFSEQLGRPGD